MRCTCSRFRTAGSTGIVLGVLKRPESWRIVKEEQGTVFRPLPLRLPPLLEANGNRNRDRNHGYDGDQYADHRALLSSRIGFPRTATNSPGSVRDVKSSLPPSKSGRKTRTRCAGLVGAAEAEYIKPGRWSYQKSLWRIEALGILAYS